ncbi:MAG TPA: polysaccharide biosynthesis/export family protein, partial [Longimicrobium sp.]|nr:polysaccharide biosynthesis/export family protein [Longimicrobium sp.]
AALAAQSAEPAPPAPSRDAMSLQPGDVVKLDIWREKDLSGEFLVDEDGVVVLPLIGERRVAGMNARDLRRQLENDYREQVRNPSITVTPLRRVNVLGEVRQPGMYTVDPTVSLVGAVALAGGHTPEGKLSDVTVVREGAVIRNRPALGASLQDLDMRSGDEIYVGRRSWLDRNSPTVVAASVSLIGGIITSLIIVNSQN